MKRMTAMLLALGLLSAALTGCQGGVTTPKTEALAEVTVGSDTYPPFVYMDENGDPTGIDVEIAHEAFRRRACRLPSTSRGCGTRMWWRTRCVFSGSCSTFCPML